MPEADTLWQAPVPAAVRSTESFPASADVVVVGGGIAGASTAFWLSRRGIRTVLCEKGVVGGEQSSRNWGWVRKMGRDPRELPLMLESERIWRDLDKLVEADVGYRRSGVVYLCDSQDELDRRESWLTHAEPFQLDTKVVRGAQLEAVLPGSGDAWAGALYTESDGRGEPQLAAPALARAAQDNGASVLTQCAVRGVETTAGRISGVVTERGRISCDAVVVAGGAWSSLLCKRQGIRLPQLKVLASVTRVEPLHEGPEAAALGPGFAFRRRQDGGYSVANGSANIADIVPDSFRFGLEFLPVLRIEWRHLKLRFGRRFIDELRLGRPWSLDEISPFERVRVLNPHPDDSAVESALSDLARFFPAFKGAKRSNRWAGLIDATPDALPVISAVDALDGLFLCTGFSGHGFGIGPGAGRLMADLVVGEAPLVDPSPFRFERFSDGRRPMPMTGL